MPHALWLLFRLRITGWFRRIGKAFQTTRGALLTIFSLLIIGTWLMGTCVGMVASPSSEVEPSTLEKIDAYAPFALLAYCVLVIFGSSGSLPIMFNPAEVQFLFSGPFSRRQLLTYKLVNQFLLALPVGIFATFGLRHIAGSIPQAFVAAVLVFTFLQLFTLAVNFVASVVGELAYSRSRRIVLLLVAVALVLAVGQALRHRSPDTNPLKTLQQIGESEIMQWLIAPFRWYVKLATARHIWPDFVKWSGICFATNAGLLIMIYLLDASFIESAAAAAEKRYARIQRIRSGGHAGAATMKAGNVKFGLPMLPWLGGAGPIAWRQLTGAVRSYRGFTILLIVIVAGGVGPGIAAAVDKEAAAPMPWILSGMALFMTQMMGQFFAFDFRGDVDRIEVLKTLPVPAWRIVAGQLITPVLFTSSFQILIVGVIYALFGTIGYLVLGVVLFAVPVNLLLIAVENWLFLLFPARLVQTTPGDFSQAGRHMLLMMAKMLTLGLGLGVPTVFGLIVFAVTDSAIAAIVVAWPIAALLSLAPIPLVAMAFRNFDVANDTPP